MADRLRKRLRNRGGERKWKGSFTVEGAVIISISFLVLGTLLLTVFYIHDKAVFQGMICEAAAAGSNYIMKTERSDAAESVRKEICSMRFLGSRDISAVKGVGEKSVSASVTAVYPVPGMFMNFLKDGKLHIACAWDSRILNPGKTIRQIRGAELLFDPESE